MHSQSIHLYIKFGAFLRFIQDTKRGYRPKREGGELNAIREVLGALESFGLPVSLRAAEPLRALHKELQAKDTDYQLSTEDEKKLRDALVDLRKTLVAEAAGNLAYIITDKRLDVRKLTSRVGELFRPGAFAKLDDVARYDFEEAGKCIAFERPTAAAFHLLRGTEGVLKTFYCGRVKRNRVSPMMWGPVVAHLRRIRNPPPAELLDNLDNIRRSFRNPTQHPEKMYDIQEVQDLFGLCVDVVNRMMSP